MKIKNFPIATIGEFTDGNGQKVVYTEEELRETARLNNEYYKSGKDCPLILTHRTDPDSPLLNNQVYAHATNYRFDENTKKLLIDADVVKGQEDEVKSGKLSTASMRRIKKDKRIAHVAFVGDQAIPTANLRFAEFENLSAEFGEIESVDYTGEGGVEIVDETFGEKFMKEWNDFKVDVKSFFSKKEEKEEDKEEIKEELKNPKEVVMDNTEELASLKIKAQEAETLKAEVETLKAEMKADKEKALAEKRKAEASTIFEQFSEKGIVVPAQKESAEKILQSEYAEEFKKFLELNKLVDFGTYAETFSVTPSDKVEELSEYDKKMVASLATNI